MRIIKDEGFPLFSLWLIVVGIWILVLRICMHVEWYEYISSPFFVCMRETVFGIVGYVMISVIVLIRMWMVRGVERAAALCLALWLLSTGLVVHFSNFQHETHAFMAYVPFVRIILGVSAGVLLLAKFQKRTGMENIGRLLLAGWMCLGSIMLVLRANLPGVSIALSGMAILSGVLLFISQFLPREPKTVNLVSKLFPEVTEYGRTYYRQPSVYAPNSRYLSSGGSLVKATQDMEFRLFKFWLIIFGAIYFCAQLYVLFRVYNFVGFNASTILLYIFCFLEMVGYGIVCVIMLIRAGKVGGAQRVVSLFLAVWLGMAGVLSVRGMALFFVIHTVIGAIVGVLLMAEVGERKNTETIGRYILGFWMIITPLIEYLAVRFGSQFSGLFGHIIEMRAALGIMALVSGVLLLISEEPSRPHPPETIEKVEL